MTTILKRTHSLLTKKPSLYRGMVLLVLIALVLPPQMTWIMGRSQSANLLQSYIVQAGDMAAAKAQVERAGGKVTHELGIINAVGAELSKSQLSALRAAGGTRVYENHAIKIAQSGSQTVRDEFEVRSYANNNGTQPWSGNWIETGDDNKPDGGSLKIDHGYLQIKDKNRSIQRPANLANVASAILSFQYRRVDDLGSNFVKLEVSNNGGTSWTELRRFSGPGKDSAFLSVSYDIRAFSSTNTIVRFMTSSNLGSQKLYVDNLQIEYTLTPPTPPSPSQNPTG